MATPKSKKKKNTKAKKQVQKVQKKVLLEKKVLKIEKNDHISLPLADIKKDLLGMVVFALVSVLFVLFLREKDVGLADLLRFFGN